MPKNLYKMGTGLSSEQAPFPFVDVFVAILDKMQRICNRIVNSTNKWQRGVRHVAETHERVHTRNMFVNFLTHGFRF